jgi:hypothetical protein
MEEPHLHSPIRPHGVGHKALGNFTFYINITDRRNLTKIVGGKYFVTSRGARCSNPVRFAMFWPKRKIIIIIIGVKNTVQQVKKTNMVTELGLQLTKFNTESVYRKQLRKK